jgi:type IX secretion system PorP/SprF family membrane protein
MRNLLVFYFIFFFFLCKAQMPNDFAESFFYAPQNTSMLLPSYAGMDADLQAKLAYRSYFGSLTALRTYWADVNYNLRQKTNYDKHVLGAGFYNEREGDFFNRQRILLRYAWHTRLGDKLYLSAGTAFHVINYLFKSSSAGSQGSDFAWSGNVGASIYSPTFRLGFSVNDFNSPSIRPVDFAFVLARFYTVHLEKTFSLSQQIKLRGSIRTNIVPEGSSTGLFHLGVLLTERIGINGFAHTSQGWGAALDVNRIEIGDSWMDISFAYKVPYDKGKGVPASAYEINVGYFFSREEK